MPFFLIRSALITFSIFWSTQSLAGGAYIYETANTTDIGTAGAGLAAKAQDASVVFNNPAGMTRIHQPEIQAGGTLLYLKAPFDSGSGTTITGPDSNTTEFFAGIGPNTAATLLSVAGDNPERLKREAALASLCGVNPLPASSGKTVRHRLNRGGSRTANNDVRKDMNYYLMDYYNWQRPHQFNDGLPPAKAENLSKSSSGFSGPLQLDHYRS